MKIKITDKPRNQHVNPPLVAGHVYQELDSKGYYFAGSLNGASGVYVVLYNLSDGKAWSSNGGYGVSEARFIDVTDNSIFSVVI